MSTSSKKRSLKFKDVQKHTYGWKNAKSLSKKSWVTRIYSVKNNKDLGNVVKSKKEVNKEDNAMKKRLKWNTFICEIKSERRISVDSPKNKNYEQLKWMEILESSQSSKSTMATERFNPINQHLTMMQPALRNAAAEIDLPFIHQSS